MIVRRRVYRVRPEQVPVFTQFFKDYLLPNQVKHGARLLGRWVTEEQDEILALWQYRSRSEYERIQGEVERDELHTRAQERRRHLGDLYLETRQDFLLSTGQFSEPRHVVAVAGYITNGRGEVLLVRTNWRQDTWELPGGQVEEGEALHAALQREIREESGIEVALHGVTGVYCNVGRGIVSVVFRGEATGGQLRPSDETLNVRWERLTPENAGQFVARPALLTRVLDAMQSPPVPYEAITNPPCERLERIEP